MFMCSWAALKIRETRVKYNMSKSQVYCCCLLLRDHFGEVVETVGKILMKNGPTPVRGIVQKSGFTIEQVKSVLRTLVQHYLVYANKNKRGFVEYSACVENILNRGRIPYYVNAARLLYQDIGEVIIDDLLHHGRSQMLDIIENVVEKIKQLHPDGQTVAKGKVHEIFSNLVQTSFIERCPEVIHQDNAAVPEFKQETDNLYNVPSIDAEESRKRKRADDDSNQPNKRIKTEIGVAATVDQTFWRINYERFHLWLRDRNIFNAVVLKLDANYAEIVATILRLSEVKTDAYAPETTPLSANEIFQGLSKNLGINRQLLDQYLTVLVDDSSNFVSKVGESGGGMYCINVKKAVIKLATNHIESVVQERFGSKCLRIFRLLLKKNHLEQQQIEQFAMIPPKEAKEMLYKMFGKSFVTVSELSKTPDHAPSRTFYMFSVNLDRIARELLSNSCRAAGNLISRRETLLHEHRRLLEKQQRVEAIVADLEQTDPSQKEDVEEMITNAERTVLAKIKHMQEKLEHSELHVDSTIFILQIYLKYKRIK